jgi:hypothetical protein
MFEFLGFIIMLGIVWAIIACFPWFFLAAAFVAVCGGIKANNEMASPPLVGGGIFVALLAGVTLLFHIDPQSILKAVL